MVVSLHDHNERDRVEGLVARARDGVVLVVSDAGAPLVSDPGFALARAGIAQGVDVRVAPGPSAVVAALTVSGLPPDRFAFEGFLPRAKGRRSRLEELAAEPRTMVFFESPRRLAATLADLAGALGPDRAAAVCRELTKDHQQVERGTLAGLAKWAAGGVLGEVTVVVAGKAPDAEVPASVLAQTLARADAGEPLRQVTQELARAHRLSRRALYEAALAARQAGPLG
jgi:16S rRNA (cytidine1402-2'-O)-methyltransferase